MGLSFLVLLTFITILNAFITNAFQTKLDFFNSKELVNTNFRIVNGNDVKEGEAPWQIALFRSYLGWPHL